MKRKEEREKPETLREHKPTSKITSFLRKKERKKGK